MSARERCRGASGQATPEWIVLVLLVALILAAATAGGLRLPGLELGRVLAAKLVCAAGLGEGCGGPGELVAALGPELAALAAEHAPELRYEEGMRALPVDFRSCREDPCSLGRERGAVTRSLTGEPITVFVDALDCREPDEARPGLDCSGARSGRIYLHYWLYYPGSQTLRAVLGGRGYHPDDWESLQVRIDGDEVAARASSHHGYNYRAGARNWASDAGLVKRGAWGPATGAYYISGGSHAGHAYEPAGDPQRWTPARALRLVPLAALSERERATRFAVTPPWRKRVARDPEYAGTD